MSVNFQRTVVFLSYLDLLPPWHKLKECNNMLAQYKLFQHSLFFSFPFFCVLDTTSCDKVCQWLAAGRWFSLSTSVFSINKTDRHDLTELLLKMVLTPYTITFFFQIRVLRMCTCPNPRWSLTSVSLIWTCI